MSRLCTPPAVNCASFTSAATETVSPALRLELAVGSASAVVGRAARSMRRKLDFCAVVSTVTKADWLAAWKPTISATSRSAALPE